MPSQKNRDELGAPTEICHNGGEIGHKSGKKRAGTAKAGQEPSRILPAFLVQSIHSQECQVVVFSRVFFMWRMSFGWTVSHCLWGQLPRKVEKDNDCPATCADKIAIPFDMVVCRWFTRLGKRGADASLGSWISLCLSWHFRSCTIVDPPSDGLDETLPRKGSRAWRDAMNHSQPEQNPLPK